MNAPRFATLRLTLALLRPELYTLPLFLTTRETGTPTMRFQIPRIRSAQPIPRCDMSVLMTGDSIKPPTPAPARIKPSAKPRCSSKYAGASARMGK